jgi:single-strand DNA-binding protein
MASLNKVLVMGHLTRDPELRYTQSGAAVTHFGMAIHRRSRQGEPWRTEVTCFDIVVWGKLAEVARQSLNQGSFAMVVGRLLGDTWETPQGQEGNQQVVADHVHFISFDQGGDPGHRLALKPVMRSLQRWARQMSRKRASRWRVNPVVRGTPVGRLRTQT